MKDVRELVAIASIKKGQVFSKLGRWQDAVNEFANAVRMTDGSDARACYLLGNAYFHVKNLSESLRWTLQAVELDSSHPRWFIRLGALYEQTKRHDQAVGAYTKATELEPSNSEWLMRLARAQSNSRMYDDARITLSNAVKISPENPMLNAEFMAATLRKSSTWQKIEALENALQTNPEKTEWIERLGREYQTLGRYERSAELHARAVWCGSKNIQNMIGLAHSARQNDDVLLEKKALDLVSKYSNSFENPKTTIAKHFQKLGDWPKAFLYHSEACSASRPEADNLYATGLSADRNHLWTESARWLRSAVEAAPERATWHYRLALSYERQGMYKEASEAYDAAIRFSDDPQSYWYFRSGICKTSIGENAEAIASFEGSSPDDSSLIQHLSSLTESYLLPYDDHLYEKNLEFLTASNNAQELHDRGLKLLRKGYYRIAARFLKEATLRSNDQVESWYFQLGLAYAKLGEDGLAVEAFKQSRVITSPHGIVADGYLKTNWRRQMMEYVEYQKNLEIDENAIVYESYFGGKVSCNPLAIFESIIDDIDYDKFCHYWVINDQADIPETVSGRKNVIFVKRGSRLYLRMLASAKYLINNVTFPHYFLRREEQRYLNTWHGTPLKTLGRDIKTGFMEHANVSRNFIQASHLLTPNKHTENVLINRYDVAGLFTGKILRSGTPRIDQVINTGTHRVQRIREILNVDSDKKIIFYAPTWRGSLDTKYFDIESLVTDLQALSNVHGATVIFRAHHMTERLLEDIELDAIVAPAEISSNELLTAADVLVTDYSSIFFDFLPLRRPIVFHVPDLESFDDERGLYFQISDMPGRVSTTTAELTMAVSESIENGISDIGKFERSMQEFCEFEDGQAAARTANAFFFDNGELDDVPKDEKKILLFHQSLLPNGITSAFLNLVKKIDTEKYRIVFLFDPAPFEKEPVRREKFNELPSYVQCIARVGAHLVSIEERWVIDKFNSWHKWGSKEQEEIFRDGFEREFHRLLGRIRVHTSIEFDGYAPFWSALMSSPRKNIDHRIVYLHNRIYKEWSTKYPELAGTMKVNNWFDKLLSVSEATNLLNRDELSTRFSIDPQKFFATNNLIDAELIWHKSSEPLDEDIREFIASADQVFLSIGRMSPEKGHSKLFEAFHRHLSHVPDAKLVLLGDGPLRIELESFIHSRGLENSIFLAGQRSNPFPVMLAADAFVLASDHEGQPMVLLEALSLGKKVIATDIVGNRGVLGDGYGLLVENSVQGVSDGMRMLNEYEPENTFDFSIYCKSAIDDAMKLYGLY